MVRFPLQAASARQTIEQACESVYDRVLREYASQGVTCLIVINQETVWPDGLAP
jgi:hypothetical protein